MLPPSLFSERGRAKQCTYDNKLTFSHWPGVRKFIRRFLYSEVIFLPTGATTLVGYGFAFSVSCNP